MLILFKVLFWSGLAHPAGKPSPDWSYVETRLQKDEDFDPEFIRTLKAHYETARFTQILELNTLLFLKKSDYHGVQINDAAIEDVRAFVETNSSALKKAEKAYGVSPEVVASLLWMESRHGKNLGNFHVPSVFVDLVQADRPNVIRYLHSAARRFTNHVSLNDRKGINSRAKKRVKWALAELKAIQTMLQRDKKIIGAFRGSFAGAFGMPQFEPSSYVAYAKSQRKGHSPDLGRAGDAVQSVAFYLHESGWRKDKGKSHEKALLKYNKSQDYAHAILSLAEQAAAPKEKERVPASQSKKNKTKKKKNKRSARETASVPEKNDIPQEQEAIAPQEEASPEPISE